MHYLKITGCLLAVTLLAGCPSTMNMKTVEVDSPRPAEIDVPDSIANLLIVDRTVYTGNPFDSNEAKIIGEIPSEAREATKTLIFFMQRYLGGSPRYQTIVATENLTGNSLNRDFPRPIPWDTVRDLCRRYGANALVAIEVYDSDYSVSNNPRRSSADQPMFQDPQQDQYSQYSQQYQYEARGAVSLTFGIRIYDPATETIIDEQMYRRRENLDATGSDPGSAVAALPQREPAIGELIHQVGEAYARRIAPVPVPVERSYFGESDNAPAMAAGTTLAESGRWQAAADAWEAGISQAPKREAGQLAYNIAIAYEKLGRTELAQEWARKASEEYGNSQARTYLAELGKEKKDTLDIDTGGNIQMPGVNINKE